MPSPFELLWRLDLTSISDAAKKWRDLSEELESAHTRYQRQVTVPLRKAGWAGEAATSAFAFLTGVENRLDIGRVEAEAIGTVLTTVHERMERARNDLKNVVRDAEAAGYSVDDSGTVNPPRFPSRYEAEEAAGTLNGYRRRMDSALTEAHQASEDGKRALSLLHGDVMGQYRQHAYNEAGSDAQAAMQLLGINEPKPPKDPEAAARWWSGLTADQRRDYMLFYPQFIGGVDGLPAAVRDGANRLSLNEQLDDPDFLTGHDYGVGTSAVLDPRHETLMQLKNALDAHAGAPEGEELYLLDFNATGDGKAVIAMGNPDTATDTGVYVPGTTTTMSSLPGSLNRIGLLQQAAEDARPKGPVSTVFWLGYDAPELDPSVVTTWRAESGAADLRRFVDGTRAAQGAMHHHITVIGHSYGSTLVGTAARGGQLGADDIVAVGSPGMNGYSDSFGIPRDHVYAGASPNDPVAQYLSGLSLGENPTSDRFGGSVFEVEPGGHSSYFDNGSIGLENMGRIIAGKTPSLVRAAPHDDPMTPIVP
ncbi:alpha/beta hydrolase [Streptomyces sp. NPDC047002]|uniref:alpha/beta hydrolase n=1 Tax=Streptomyces sp. NPDC047002 TaxID=3155475 RepID=UPI00345670F7